MPYYKFEDGQIFYNTLKTYPEVQFDVNANEVFLNNRNHQPGAFSSEVKHVDVGNLSLFELNIDRPSDSLIYPFITKEGSFEAIGNVSVKDYFSSFEYGDTITGSYPLSASLTREHFAANHGTTSPSGSHILALKNVLNYYTPLTKHYAFTNEVDGESWDKTTQELSLLYIPAIFYESQIKKGSVDLKFYISGNLVAQAKDPYFNGELVQVDGDGFASAAASAASNRTSAVVGVVLYKEGVIVLTGSWNLTPDNYDRGDDSGKFRWIDFAAGANDGTSDVSPSASFTVNFEGVSPIQTITMFAHAKKPDLNYSTNLSFMDYDSYQAQPATASTYQYKQSDNIKLFNAVSSSFYQYEEHFKHQTFINKIGVYDEHKNLIAVANLATPVKKTNIRDFTFKLKLDV